MRLSDAETKRLLKVIVAAVKSETDDCITDWPGRMHCGRAVFSGVAVVRHVAALLFGLDARDQNFRNTYSVKLECGNRACFNPRHILAEKIIKKQQAAVVTDERIAAALSMPWRNDNAA